MRFPSRTKDGNLPWGEHVARHKAVVNNNKVGPYQLFHHMRGSGFIIERKSIAATNNKEDTKGLFKSRS